MTLSDLEMRPKIKNIMNNISVHSFIIFTHSVNGERRNRPEK